MVKDVSQTTSYTGNNVEWTVAYMENHTDVTDLQLWTSETCAIYVKQAERMLNVNMLTSSTATLSFAHV